MTFLSRLFRQRLNWETVTELIPLNLLLRELQGHVLIYFLQNMLCSDVDGINQLESVE